MRETQHWERNITKKSKVDCTVYTAINQSSKKVSLVVALIEVMCSITEHSIAQAIGYYSSFTVPEVS